MDTEGFTDKAEEREPEEGCRKETLGSRVRVSSIGRLLVAIGDFTGLSDEMALLSRETAVNLSNTW